MPLALTTIGILRGRQGDPQVQGFWDRWEAIVESVYRAPGLIVAVDPSELPDGRPWSPPARFAAPEYERLVAVTLSLWEDVESASAFSYRNLHGEALQLRKEWFEKLDLASHAAWWHEGDVPPTSSEASQRLERIWTGESPDAFLLQRPFDADGQPYEVDRDRVRALAAELAGA